jgi:hypothetical protein
MMARQLVGAMIAAVLATGCGRELNRVFCDKHPEDVDCRNAGFVAIDAPMGECQSSMMCGGATPVCDTASQTCVQCIIDVNVNACSGTFCGQDNQCHGCVFDANCTASGVCLPNGMCADAGVVLYARPMGTGDCSQANPCTFTQAVAAVTPTRHIVKLTVNSGLTYREGPLSFATAQEGVQILADSAVFEPNANGDAITVTAGNVEIVGLTIRNTNGSGINCDGNATFAMRRGAVTDNAGFGIVSQGCKVTIERTRFQRNPSGAMDLTAGTLELRNNIIDHNGTSDSLDNGNVTMTNVSGRFVFNTVVQNLSKGGGSRIGGINCTAASGLSMLISRNIISSNGGGSTFGGDCVPVANFTGAFDMVQFNNNNEYKLTAATPPSTIRDDPMSLPDCTLTPEPMLTYIDDFEGQSRPAGYCDRGADEYKP